MSISPAMEVKLHPGVEVGLRRLSMTETDVAEAIRDGELASPQPFENALLVDVRISGTGVSYRPKLKEWVYRRPEIYLTEEFLKRCQGIPVIYDHPKGTTLDSDTFTQHVVGVMSLPYIKGEEVWGIARIYDRPTIDGILSEPLSTSPAVIFRDPKVNYQIELEDGKTLLVEGNPSYVDHLAICEKGVWDKGGDPVGVRVDAVDVPIIVEDSRFAAMADSVEKLSQRMNVAIVARSIDRLAGRIDRYLRR